MCGAVLPGKLIGNNPFECFPGDFLRKCPSTNPISIHAYNSRSTKVVLPKIYRFVNGNGSSNTHGYKLFSIQDT